MSSTPLDQSVAKTDFYRRSHTEHVSACKPHVGKFRYTWAEAVNLEKDTKSLSKSWQKHKMDCSRQQKGGKTSFAAFSVRGKKTSPCRHSCNFVDYRPLQGFAFHIFGYHRQSSSHLAQTGVCTIQGLRANNPIFCRVPWILCWRLQESLHFSHHFGVPFLVTCVDL